MPPKGDTPTLDDLPPFRAIVLRNELDRYGFSSVVASLCGFRKPLRSFCSWVHGWIWFQPTVDNLGFQGLPRDECVVVRDEIESFVLKTHGFTNVVIGGLPFAYVPRQGTNRISGSILAILPHSSEVERCSLGVNKEYIDCLAALKTDYSFLCICIHYLDKGGIFDTYARSRGLHVIYGARPDDANSLRRIRSCFEKFEFVTSNNIGSHFIYALSSGCKFSFFGPFYDYKETILSRRYDLFETPELSTQLALEAHSEPYVRSLFSKFFKASPYEGISDEQFASLTLCPAGKLSPTELKRVLGWDLRGQTRGYICGASRRISRLIKNSAYL